MSEKPHFCVDCDHFTLLGEGREDDDHICLLHAHKKLNLVTGLQDYVGDRVCYDEREEGSPCGPQGVFFQSRGLE